MNPTHWRVERKDRARWEWIWCPNRKHGTVQASAGGYYTLVYLWQLGHVDLQARHHPGWREWRVFACATARASAGGYYKQTTKQLTSASDVSCFARTRRWGVPTFDWGTRARH